jgi:hypothetical protein
MDSIIHLSSEVDIYILFSLYCAYTYEVVNLCCKVVFYSSLHGCVQCDLTSAAIRLWANSEPDMLVCVLQVNAVRLEPTMVSGIDSMLVDCHWSRTVSLHAKLQLPSSRPCPRASAAGHNSDLLFLCPVMSLTCFCRPSHQPPAAGDGSGSAAAGPWPPVPHAWW